MLRGRVLGLRSKRSGGSATGTWRRAPTRDPNYPQLSCTRLATRSGRQVGQIRRMSTTSPAAAQGRILVVDDDPKAALFAVYVLANRARFDVTHPAEPAAALRLAVT